MIVRVMLTYPPRESCQAENIPLNIVYEDDVFWLRLTKNPEWLCIQGNKLHGNPSACS
jgi:23S rRNA-/tRNA-specific pseudouridylate synthase